MKLCESIKKDDGSTLLLIGDDDGGNVVLRFSNVRLLLKDNVLHVIPEVKNAMLVAQTATIESGAQDVVSKFCKKVSDESLLRRMLRIAYIDAHGNMAFEFLLEKESVPKVFPYTDSARTHDVCSLILKGVLVRKTRVELVWLVDAIGEQPSAVPPAHDTAAADPMDNVVAADPMDNVVAADPMHNTAAADSEPAIRSDDPIYDVAEQQPVLHQQVSYQQASLQSQFDAIGEVTEDLADVVSILRHVTSNAHAHGAATRLLLEVPFTLAAIETRLTSILASV